MNDLIACAFADGNDYAFNAMSREVTFACENVAVRIANADMAYMNDLASEMEGETDEIQDSH